MTKIDMRDVFSLRKIFDPRAFYLDKNILFALRFYSFCLICTMRLRLSSAERKKKRIASFLSFFSGQSHVKIFGPNPTS